MQPASSNPNSFHCNYIFFNKHLYFLSFSLCMTLSFLGLLLSKMVITAWGCGILVLPPCSLSLRQVFQVYTLSLFNL